MNDKTEIKLKHFWSMLDIKVIARTILSQEEISAIVYTDLIGTIFSLISHLIEDGEPCCTTDTGKFKIEVQRFHDACDRCLMFSVFVYDRACDPKNNIK